ncbi:class I adenylate-forming enzyme family protein [Lacisediminimonas profundi]|uniref:class I adenylate-forming enzyme family protein n=1 Tax=Lacisediminimonas profundi TaxID=2603856 RepID=UPI00124B29AB|nr:AMP-binding protein [Lacisediminimonas profundi]
MLTLSNMLRATAQCYGTRPAILDADGDQAGNLNWDQYFEQIRKTAGALRRLGLQPGDRFATLCRNCVLHGQLLNAGYWAGVVPVVLNFRLSPAEIAQLLEDAQCDVLMIDNAFLPLLDQSAFARYRERAIVVPVDGSDPCFPRLDDMIALSAPLPGHEAHEDDDAIILYTGGTTGRGKGVRLSHRNVMSNALQLSRVINPDEYDIYLHVSPMFHSTDLKATVVTMFGGGHVYHKEFSVDAVLQSVERHRVSILSLVPTMIVRVLKEGRLDQYDLSALRLVSYGTSPIGEGTLRAAMAAFPHAGFHQCYGLTEASPLLALLDEPAHRRALQDKPELLRAAGRPLPGVDMRFLDDNGQEVPRGEIGEIVVRGPQVSKGYWNRPEDNASAFRDGWFHTGDVGRLDEDGYLYVLDRKKDMVITGGENVYTREVENVLHQHPDVADVAVVGVPDEKFGEALLAAIVLRAGREAPPEQALIEFCRSQLGGFKIPRRYLFVDQFPRTTMGKIRKPEIAQMYLRKAETAAP